MVRNRSAPWALLTPVLSVEDVRAAVAWYVDVLGLVEHVQIGEAHRAQLGVDGEPPSSTGSGTNGCSPRRYETLPPRSGEAPLLCLGAERYGIDTTRAFALLTPALLDAEHQVARRGSRTGPWPDKVALA